MRVDPFGGEERKTLDRECGFVAPESEREEEAVRTYISNAIPRRDACKRKARELITLGDFHYLQLN